MGSECCQIQYEHYLVDLVGGYCVALSKSTSHGWSLFVVGYTNKSRGVTVQHKALCAMTSTGVLVKEE